MKNFVKYVFDYFLAILLIAPASVIIIVCSIIVLLQLKQFPLFLQERSLTLSKKSFKIVKIRTLKKCNSHYTLHRNIDDVFFQNHLKNKTTKFTSLLRRTGIDELPQIFNILMGQMSFIGPRPLMLIDLQIMKKNNPSLYEQREKLSVKPGITGLWQLFGERSGGQSSLVSLDLFYNSYWSVAMDFALMFKTVGVMIKGTNSDSVVPNKIIIQETSKEKDEKSNIRYSINLPDNWWFVNNSYSNKLDKKDKNNIFKIAQ